VETAFAYYYSTSTIQTIDLVSYLKYIVRSVNKTGFKIVATVCDQGGTNRTAINYFMSETYKNYTERNLEKTNLGYEIDGQEIIPNFDPPHLLKCIRNNLFNKDVIFDMDGNTFTASWDHIVAMYEFDKKNEEFELRTLLKLNDNHINIAKSNKSFKCCTSLQPQSSFNNEIGV